VIFRNDIDKVLDYVDIVRKFADKTKIGQEKTKRQGEAAGGAWCFGHMGLGIGGLALTYPNSRSLHLGGSILKHESTMGGQKLANIGDIGVTIADNLKLSTQSAKATKKSPNRSWPDQQGFSLQTLDLEFSSRPWSPWMVTDKEGLWRVHIPTEQKWTVRIVSGQKETE
jgi:hypothetical protein